MLAHPVVLETASAVSQPESASFPEPHLDLTKSAKERLRGIWVPVVTPFKDGILDVTALRNLTQQLVNSGVHGLVACSTTGEFGSLSFTEKLTIIEILLEISDEEIPVLVGLNGIETTGLIQQARMLERYDIFGFMLAPPPFVKPSQAGLIKHFKLIADSINKPIVLYNVPSRCGVTLELDSLKALACHPHIIGLKESSGSLPNLIQAIAHTPLNVMCGDDALTLSAMQYGATGAISAAAHIHTDVFISIYEFMNSGNLKAAKKQFQHYEKLIALLFRETNPAPLKALLAHQGLIEPELRLPLTNVSDALRKELVSTIEQLAIDQGSSTIL
jgi:4-hydroxy-tetrahydrodipicolinate synthase